jgi:hypothetical protein
MANPRDAVIFDRIGYKAQTYEIDDVTITYDATKAGGSDQVGLAATLLSDDTAELTDDGDLVLGEIIKVEADGKVVIQTEGYTKLPGGDGATLTIGEKIVGDLGASNARGYIRAVATGTAAELGHARGAIINNDTTTAVVVRLP